MLHDAIICALGDDAIDRTALIDRLAGIEPALAARAIGKMVAIGKLKQDADGAVSVNADWQPGQRKRRKKRKAEPEVESEVSPTVLADEAFRPAITADGALLIFGVLQEHGILEFTPAQTNALRDLLARNKPAEVT